MLDIATLNYHIILKINIPAKSWQINREYTHIKINNKILVAASNQLKKVKINIVWIKINIWINWIKKYSKTFKKLSIINRKIKILNYFYPNIIIKNKINTIKI